MPAPAPVIICAKSNRLVTLQSIIIDTETSLNEVVEETGKMLKEDVFTRVSALALEEIN
jgi:hypothetical protein